MPKCDACAAKDAELRKSLALAQEVEKHRILLIEQCAAKDARIREQAEFLAQANHGLMELENRIVDLDAALAAHEKNSALVQALKSLMDPETADAEIKRCTDAALVKALCDRAEQAERERDEARAALAEEKARVAELEANHEDRTR